MKIPKFAYGLLLTATATMISCTQTTPNNQKLEVQGTLLTRVEAESMTAVGSGCGAGIGATAVTYYCNQSGTAKNYNFTQTGRFSILVRGASSANNSAGISVYVAGNKVGAVSFSGTTYSNQSATFDLTTSGSKEVRLFLETDNGSNDTLVDWYELNYEGVIPPPPPAPVLPSSGAYASGVHRNMFREWNSSLTEADTTAKINAYWDSLFASSDPSKSIYRPDGSNANGAKAYILTDDTNDVRSEGMSYGMMIAVQMNKETEFKALWNWAKSVMQHQTGARAGYFCWQASTAGSCMDANPAPDGEEYMAMALFFAGHRWGNKTGIYNYTAEANAILNVMIHKTDMNGGTVDSIGNMFDRTQKQIVFVPYANNLTFTDPSYHLPAFYELFSLWATGYTNSAGQNQVAADQTFWADVAKTSRDFLSNAANGTSGLTADYANFDGSGCCGRTNFWVDSWRTAMNWGVDYAWWAKNPPTAGKANAVTLTNRIQSFFETQGVTTYGNEYELPSNRSLNSSNSDGLVATNAATSLASNNARSWKFIDAFWNRAIPTGSYRYFNGLLAFMSALHLSGNFKIYKPGTPPPSTPLAPSSLGTSAVSSSQINLTWADNSNNETGFSIERKTGTGAFAQVTTVGAGVTTYNNTGLTASTAYTYRVRAYNANGNSAYSNESSATTNGTGAVPTAPSSLAASATSSSQINLTWVDNSNNETGFSIERKTGTGAFAQVTTVGAGITAYNDTGLTASTAYTYRVRAYNTNGNSVYSNEISATTQSGGTNRDAYTNLEAESFNTQSGTSNEAGDGGTVVNFTNASSYIILNNVNFGTSGAGSVQFRANTLTSGENLQIRIGSQTASPFCTVYPDSNGLWHTKSNTCYLPTKPTGLQNVYVTVTGATKINWLKFVP
jgi:oligosaccharide reducing-end xylanase